MNVVYLNLDNTPFKLHPPQTFSTHKTILNGQSYYHHLTRRRPLRRQTPQTLRRPPPLSPTTAAGSRSPPLPLSHPSFQHFFGLPVMAPPPLLRRLPSFPITLHPLAANNCSRRQPPPSNPKTLFLRSHLFQMDHRRLTTLSPPSLPPPPVVHFPELTHSVSLRRRKTPPPRRHLLRQPPPRLLTPSNLQPTYRHLVLRSSALRPTTVVRRRSFSRNGGRRQRNRFPLHPDGGELRREMGFAKR